MFSICRPTLGSTAVKLLSNLGLIQVSYSNISSMHHQGNQTLLCTNCTCTPNIQGRKQKIIRFSNISQIFNQSVFFFLKIFQKQLSCKIPQKSQPPLPSDQRRILHICTPKINRVSVPLPMYVSQQMSSLFTSHSYIYNNHSLYFKLYNIQPLSWIE